MKEFFAPVFMVQPYSGDSDRAAYFEHPDYARNAIYVTVFGRSPYVRALVGVGCILDLPSSKTPTCTVRSEFGARTAA